jgi:hypothetical protein
VELLLQSWFGGAGALPNTPLILHTCVETSDVMGGIFLEKKLNRARMQITSIILTASFGAESESILHPHSS